MAEINKQRLTPCQEELQETRDKIFEQKEVPEANIISSIYQRPDLIHNLDLKVEDFSHNEWRVFYAIAQDIVMNEKKNTLDDMTVAFYLEKHPKLREKYAGGSVVDAQNHG